jgi:hypothetical protein
MKILIFVLITLTAFSAHANPCDGIDRKLTGNRKSQLAPIIAKQLSIESVEIFDLFKYRGWYIILVETHISDEPFLIFKGDPVYNTYTTMWSGAAANFEGPEIKKWVLNNAKGIPAKLARCFAWHVTQE